MRASGELADPFTPPSLCLSMASILLWDLGLRLPNDNEPPAVNIKPVKLLQIASLTRDGHIECNLAVAFLRLTSHIDLLDC
jgi:hypothetical protein